MFNFAMQLVKFHVFGDMTMRVTWLDLLKLESDGIYTI